MQRRHFVSVLAAVALGACATAQPEALPPNTTGAYNSDRISVVARGHGPDVILIPGLTSSRDVWESTAAALESRYRVHLVQVKGFAGLPAESNAEGAVSAPVAEAIARYIDDQHLSRPAVIGHSMGGTSGMMLAARHPDRVGRLMVVDMFPWMGAMFGPPGATSDSVRPTADQIRGQILSAPPGTAMPMMEQMIANMTQTETARPMLMQHLRTSDRNTVANAFHELIVTDLRPELANIRAPVTVLYVIPPNVPIPPAQYEGYMRASYTNLPQARLVKIDDSYHFIMLDQPERFISEVRTFLAN